MSAGKRQPFVPQSVGARIAHARRQLAVREGRDLLVPDLAERVGVSAQAFYAWEADEAVPGKKNLDKLAAVLGVSKAWLHYGVDDAAAAFTPAPSSPAQKKRGA